MYPVTFPCGSLHDIYFLMFTFSHSECSVHSNWSRIRTRAINTGSDLHGIRCDSERACVEGSRGRGGGRGRFRTTPPSPNVRGLLTTYSQVSSREYIFTRTHNKKYTRQFSPPVPLPPPPPPRPIHLH